MPQLQLVVWDFDHSMVNENTDTFVFDLLAPELRARLTALAKTAQFAGKWTKLVDHMLGELAAAGVTPEALQAAVAETPMFEEVISAVKALHAAGVEQRILSGAFSSCTSPPSALRTPPPALRTLCVRSLLPC